MNDTDYEPQEFIDPTSKNESDSDIKSDPEEVKKFNHTLQAARQIIFRARNIFPFDFFPDEIVIDENKIDVIARIFFMSQQVYSIPYTYVTGATSSVGLFFGSLSIEIQGFEENPPMLKWLGRQDAIKARRIINGMVTAHRQGIDLKKLDLIAMRDKLEEIGEAQRS